MADSMKPLKDQYARSQRGLLKMVEELTDEQLAWRPTPTSHNIAFQVWHAARTADDIQVTLRRVSPSVKSALGEGREIWQSEGLAARWKLEPSTLGAGESGYEMEDSAAARMALPGKQVLDYARRSFEALERALEAVEPKEWTELRYDHWGTGQPLWVQVLMYLGHNDWNVGYIAALRRAQNLPRVMG